MRSHNFRRMSFKCKDQSRSRFYCKNCDSVVEYPKIYSEADVNRILNSGKLKCFEPLKYKN